MFIIFVIIKKSTYTNTKLNSYLEYIHIPNTCGTSIEDLGKIYDFKWGRFNESIEYLNKIKYSNWHNPNYIIPKNTNLFTIIRNPYDRIISEFFYLNRVNLISYNKNIDDFYKFIDKYLNLFTDNNNIFNYHLTPQTTYTHNENNNQRIRHIIKMDNNMNSNLDILFKKYNLNIDINKLPYNNISNKTFTVNEINQEYLDKIYNFYERDFKLLNYNKIIKKINTGHKNLIFTSAGDNTSFYNNWVGNNQNYDIFLVYYGDNDENYLKYKDYVTYLYKKKGAKYPNFYHTYNNYSDIIRDYEYIFLLDDDIIFDNVNDINELFSIHNKYDLWLSNPSRKDKSVSKNDHLITEQKPNSLLRYTNFVENGLTIFSKYAINKFMKYYEGDLNGHFVDYMYINILGKDIKDKYAIIDKISCINPYDNDKQDTKREWSKLKDNNDVKIWNGIRKKFNYINIQPKEYNSVNN